MGLVAIKQVKDYLVGIGEKIPEDHDPILQFIGDGVSTEVEIFCRRKFAQATYTAEQHTGVAGQKHFLPHQWPLGTITSVKIDDVVIAAGTNDDQYRTVKDASGDVYALFRRNTWESKEYGLEITYQAGYAADKIPDDLEKAIAQLSAEEYLFRGKQGLSGESLGGMSLTFDRWPMNVLKVLQKYRRPIL